MSSISTDSIESTDSRETEQDIKSIVRTIKRQLTASESFNQFIQLSSSHAVIMQNNLQTVQPILLQIILNLLSSFKFKFVTTVECNGFGRRSFFTEMIYQMDKFKMDDHTYWSQIIIEAKKSIEKFYNTNKTKYEDLVQFIHSTLDHVSNNNITLDLESFAILFNIQIAANMPPVKNLNLTPVKPKPSHLVNVMPVRVKGSKAVPRSASSSNSHVRVLNFDMNFELEYKLQPIDVSPIKYYRRPNNYKAFIYILPEPRLIPLEKTSITMDPRSIHMAKWTPKPVEPRRMLGKITVHIDPRDDSEISRPAKRRRIVWDME